MRVDDFDFDLPEDRIALRPLADRERAKLLVIGGDAFEDALIGDLTRLLRAGDLLVTNNTKVIPAFLKATRPARDQGGGTRPVTIDLTLHLRKGPDVWAAFAKPAKRLKLGDRLTMGDDTSLAATVIDKGTDGAVVLCFDQSGPLLDAAIAKTGLMPLPPYISSKRDVDGRDASDYQTIFASKEGAVAAPTASLHFTSRLLERLEANHISRAEITLHVGAGTFLPVKVEDTADHVMHAEWGEIPGAVADQIRQVQSDGGRIVAAGTTALRLLESAVGHDGRIGPYAGETDIFITPGFQFQVVDLLLTNFHLPRSTLFMLVCAFAGLDTMRAAYAHAIETHYRFYSYGDACLLSRHDLAENLR